MSAKWLFTFKYLKFPLLPLLTHSSLSLSKLSKHYRAQKKAWQVNIRISYGIKRRNRDDDIDLSLRLWVSESESGSIRKQGEDFILTGKDNKWNHLQERVRAKNAFISLWCLIITESERWKMGGESFSPETTAENETIGKTATINAIPGTTQNETNSPTEVFTRRFYILAVFSIFTMEQVQKHVLQFI